MTFIVDNLGTVQRARAILANLKGDDASLPGLLIDAEKHEALAEESTNNENDGGDCNDRNG